MKYVLIRYGEIGLKGNNRAFFEKYLASNIRKCLDRNEIEYDDIKRYRGRIIIRTEDNCNCLKYVFGITSFSSSVKTELDIDSIRSLAKKYYDKGSFRISTKRLDKRVNWSSQEMNKLIGDVVEGKVDLDNPDVDIGIELHSENAYVFSERIKGLGGLPVGVEGLVTLLVEDLDSIYAGVLMLKRGCSVEVVLKNKIKLELLEKFSNDKIKIVKTPSKHSEGLVVNDKIDNMKEYDFKTIFRPLIGYKNLSWIKN